MILQNDGVLTGNVNWKSCCTFSLSIWESFMGRSRRLLKKVLLGEGHQDYTSNTPLHLQRKTKYTAETRNQEEANIGSAERRHTFSAHCAWKTFRGLT